MRYEDDDIIFTATLMGRRKGLYELPTMTEAVLFSAAKPISIDMLEEVFGLSTEKHKIYRRITTWTKRRTK